MGREDGKALISDEWIIKEAHRIGLITGLKTVRALVPTLDQIADNFTEHPSGDWVRYVILSEIDQALAEQSKRI
jgi:hypothetical protein